MAHSRSASHPYGRVLLIVGNIHTKYGISYTRGGGGMTIRIQKFQKYHDEIQ
jgi:hypothetical protein